MTDQANTPHTSHDMGRLDINDAVNAILIPEDSEPEQQAAPSDEEVTEVSVEEAAITAGNEQRDPIQEGIEAEKAQPTEQETEDEPAPEEASEEDGDDEEDNVEAQAETDQEPEEADTDEEEQEVLYTTSDGEEVTLEELKKGYLRQSDYTKKTQSLSETRDQVLQGAQRLTQDRQTLAENLNMALNVIEPQLAELAQTDWNTLAASDAYEYAEKRALFDQAQARYNQIQQAAQQVVQQQQTQTEANFKTKMAAEQKALAMALPDLADPTKGRQLRNAIREYAISGVGLNEKEASGIYDHRMIVVLNKARMYDELQSSGLSVAKKKVSKTPKKVVQPGQPVTKAERNEQSRQQQRAKLAKSGSVDDAVDLLLANM